MAGSDDARLNHHLIAPSHVDQDVLTYNEDAVSERRCDAMTTVDLNVTLQLPEDVERSAREAGLFTGEKLAQMIEAEVRRRRREAWERLQARLAPVQAAFREEHGHLSDDEVQTMIDQWIDEADTANDERHS
jgi:post-segregation antitoxin (ccd killing protein)